MNTMTKAMGLSFLLAVSAFFCAPAFAADSAADVKAMHDVDQAWLKAYTAADGDALAALYDDNAILMPPGAPAAKGRAAIRAFLGNDSAASQKAGVSFHLGANPDGGANGDLGWVSGTYTVTDKAGKVVESGKYLSVSKKEGGKWRYIRDTWNADGAAPAETPAKK
jgi:ketosteroid isomerase-like protein